jgi:S-adenosylmethionine hydrolase
VNVVRPCIAFLSDFGTRDHYVGAMKGVALAICPEATLVDITHDIAPHDVIGGALELAAAYKYFPQGTVFVAVVDPGVGSARLAIAAEAGGFWFVGPDNGVLSLVLRDTPPSRVVALTEAQYARPTISRTFEGRDRFAPAAAWLAQGTDIGALGPPLSMWQTLDVPEPRISGHQLTGQVVRVDRFGNLVTNIDRRTFDAFAAAGEVSIAAGPQVIGALVETYAQAPLNRACALFGSSDHLEIAVNGGNAAQRLSIGLGAPVAVSYSDRS